MKLALLKGNRFNPWHLLAFDRLRGQPEVVAFRAESKSQRDYDRRGAGAARFRVETVYFDTQAGPVADRITNRALQRFRGREPRLLPFRDRLRSFDLIQTWELYTDWSAEALEARADWRIPMCVMVWDNIPFNMEPNRRRRELKCSVAASADRFIVHTDRSRRMLDVEGVGKDRVVHIDPGVDTELFSPGPADRAAFGLEDDDLVILFVGWLLPRKGVDFLLLALRELVRDASLEKHRVKLLMVGSGSGRARVERFAGRLGVQDRCSFTGGLSYGRMRDVFRCADVFVLPSIATPEWQEQYCMSLLEAMSCGVPVVSTMTGATSEFLGDAGRLCQPSDFVSLYEALRDIILEPSQRQDLGAQSRERAVSKFGLQRYADALSSLYDELREK